MDPCLLLMDPESGPITGILSFSTLLLFEGTLHLLYLSKIKSHKEGTKQ
jgi:hypothetical protein